MKKIVVLVLMVFVFFGFGYLRIEASSLPTTGSKVLSVYSSYTTPDGVNITTRVSRNYGYGTSTHFDVSHTISNESILIATDNSSNLATLSYALDRERYYNHSLSLYFANNAAGVDQNIISGTVSAKMIYVEKTYRTLVNDIYWYDNEFVSKSNPISHSLSGVVSPHIVHYWADHSVQLITGNRYDISLQNMFINNNKYQTLTYGYYPTSYLQYKQLTIPEITGFEIQYTVKTDAIGAYSITEGSVPLRKLLTTVGYFTTSSSKILTVNPSMSVSCGIAFSTPFFGCSGPSLTLLMVGITTNPTKVHTSSYFSYSRNMIYDNTNNRISQDITNVTYPYTLTDIRSNYFELISSGSGGGGGTGTGCSISKPFCIVRAPY